jgi:branched-chain amino acid transport system substrate-binding protein
MSNVSFWVTTVMIPAGPEKGVGIISSTYSKDPNDPAWAEDPGMKQWHDFMRKYMPSADPTDANYINSFGMALTLAQVLRQCGDDLSRENVMRQAANLHDFEVPTLLPGIKLNTSPTDFHPIKQMQLQRWDGRSWVRFGELISGAD